MHKISLKGSKAPKISSVRGKRASRSIPLKKAKIALTIASNGYASPKKPGKNTGRRNKSIPDEPKFNSLFEEALNLKSEGDYDRAILVLKKTIRLYPDVSILHWLVGALYFCEFHLPKKALRWFRKAVALAPKTELASLGLFHALWALDRCDEALEELKRYQVLVGYTCEDYCEIVAEINEKWSNTKD